MRLFINLSFGMLLLTTLPVFSDYKIEDMMTAKEREETGISSLSAQELGQLNLWLNRRMLPLQDPDTTGLSTKHILNNGKLLVLSNQAVYEIAPDSVQTVASWYYSYPVVLMDSQDKDYPVKIINTFTGDAILAKRIK